MSTTMIIEEFEPDVFRQLIEYIHTGCVLLQARTLLGLLNAADYYGLEQLRKACLRFVSCCITVDTVCSLLSTAERYIQYKCTKSIVQKVLEFVDTHADEIFKLNAFGLLPEHVVRLILARDGLQADEQAKYNGVYTWCEHYCRSYELTNIADVMRNFLDFIQFHKIPTNVLLSEIYPTHTVPDAIFLSALAYQAEPRSVAQPSLKARRMTLPNAAFHGSKEPAADVGPCESRAEERDKPERRELNQQQPQAGRAGRPAAGPSLSSWSSTSWARGESKRARRAAAAAASQPRSGRASRDSTTSSSGTRPASEQQPAAPAAISLARKSVGSQPAAQPSGRPRKASIAQVSMSGVRRLSHKLSMRRRAGRGESFAAEGRARRPSQLSKQQSLHAGSSMASRGELATKDAADADGDDDADYEELTTDSDPLRVGKQILDAFLEQQRQREAQERAAQRQQQVAPQQQAQQAGELADEQQQQQAQAAPASSRQPTVKVSLSTTRKSFKDFKHISRRIFMRHSSSNKILQQRQQSVAASGHQAAPASSSSSSANLGSGSSPATGQLHQTHQQQPQPQSSAGARDRQNVAAAAASSAGSAKRRNVLKIKRSETVFERTSGAAAGLGSRLSHQLSANLLGK